MLEVERQFFEDNREDLLRKFPGKFVVIKGHHLLAPFDSIEEALGVGAEQHGMTSFLVRRTDQQPEEVSIPALTLGLLSADSSQPTERPGTNF
jgi:hypothetical protein